MILAHLVMWFVYVLKSMNHPYYYVGHTHDVEKRLDQHNSGLNQSTKHYTPFDLETYVAVKTEKKAIELEKYFKVGLGESYFNEEILKLENNVGLPDEAIAMAFELAA